jgi:hypothetical protein
VRSRVLCAGSECSLRVVDVTLLEIGQGALRRLESTDRMVGRAMDNERLRAMAETFRGQVALLEVEADKAERAVVTADVVLEVSCIRTASSQ